MERTSNPVVQRNQSINFVRRFRRKVRKDFQHGHLKGVATGIIRVTASLVVRRREFVFMRRPLDLIPPRYRKLKHSDYREMVVEDIKKISFIDRRKKAQLRKYFDDGCQGWVSSINGKICGFHFSSFTSVREAETGVEIRVLPGQVYQFDGIVAPSERGKAIAVSHLIRFWQDMRERGLTEAFCFVDRGNRASERLHKRMGFAPFAVYQECRICGFLLERRHTRLDTSVSGS